MNSGIINIFAYTDSSSHVDKNLKVWLNGKGAVSVCMLIILISGSDFIILVNSSPMKHEVDYFSMFSQSLFMYVQK